MPGDRGGRHDSGTGPPLPPLRSRVSLHSAPHRAPARPGGPPARPARIPPLPSTESPPPRPFAAPALPSAHPKPLRPNTSISFTPVLPSPDRATGPLSTHSEALDHIPLPSTPLTCPDARTAHQISPNWPLWVEGSGVQWGELVEPGGLTRPEEHTA